MTFAEHYFEDKPVLNGASYPKYTGISTEDMTDGQFVPEKSNPVMNQL